MLYVFLANGFEEIEALTVVDILRRLGIEVATVSNSSDECVTGSHGIVVKADMVFGEADFSKADGLILPGGLPGATNLQANEALCRALLKAHEGRKLVAAICAAPMVLGSLGILRGRRATCYPGMEAKLEGAIVTEQMAVTDGHIVTGRGPAAAAEFAFAIGRKFADGATLESVRAGMLFENC